MGKFGVGGKFFLVNYVAKATSLFYFIFLIPS